MGDKLVRKGLVVVIIFLFIGISIIPSTSTLVKKSSIMFYEGKTLYVGGNGPGNYTKIQDAVDNAVDGDTVFVYDDISPYYENVVISKSINFIGEDKNTTVIDGMGVEDNNILTINADNVKVSGFTFQNITEPNTYCIEIWANESIITDNIFINSNTAISIEYNNNIISNNTISNIEWFGIALDWVYNCSIKNNIINNVAIGIACFWYSKFNKITQNIINNTLSSIEIHESNNNLIAYNDVSYSNYGIWIDGSSNNTISFNNIYNLNIEYANNSWKIGTKKSIFYSNYWGKPLTHPKPIPSAILIPIQMYHYIDWIPISIITFDWHPAQKPYDITTTQGCDIV